ncbi:Outer membrane efflux protein precursor [uncultured Candidatus Thioglobus sp.]|nr:Outer membrane efflux protein precursor [uncultured Candidatus Thioglobus sp.]
MRFILALLALSISLNVSALNEQEFVKQLRATHPFFNQQALSSQIRKIEKQATTANRDWLIAVDTTYKNEDTKHVTGVNYEQLNTRSIGIYATKKHVSTGSDITFKHAWIEKSKGVENNHNQFSIDYNYPLLKNKNGINDRLNTDVAQIAIDKNTIERLEAEEDFIVNKLVRFVDLAYAQQQWSINQHRLALANKELTLVKRKYDNSVVEKVDVLLQQDAYQQANQQLLKAQQELTLLRYEIAITLGLDFEQVVAVVDLYKIYLIQITGLRAYLLKNSRLLKINQLAQKTLKRQLRSFKNTAKAKLDLNLGLASVGDDADYSTSINNQSPVWKIGLNLSYPLGNIESNSNTAKANAQLASLMQNEQEQLLNIHIQAKMLKEKIGLLKQLLQSSQEQIATAKARTVEEKQRYIDGNGQASFVINAQNNEQSAQLSYAQVARDYQKAVLEFKAATDQLVQ